jgi:hypothetical protein
MTGPRRPPAPAPPREHRSHRSRAGAAAGPPGGAPTSETSLQRLRHHGAARVGIALPAGSFRDWVITDLCALSRVRP